MDENESAEAISKMLQASVVIGLHKALVPWETTEHKQMENAVQNNSVHEMQTILINALVRNLTTNQYAMRTLTSAMLDKLSQVSRSM